ncbi:hypothetical protein K493DRAFT_306766 [Basidiobolus meristosporus CBS 931.73]|uniref:SCP domain-containing protein n=1 Tax=Basidiobolus meristosporus CBS 931.73 TaxID=1314790 RepID=A0A1Y1XQY2_9FUNG|nr:hypothetical protein K493DRAFT_306764 [Basidiobolus meristosporus CBS 931.73]ORX88150.1 hypothetical protein K493DRAFT_306766 [Basidiobolus meristosporus CBS 931.73]|eukprot:ORX88148.1 hypothetical protein K493DRAFT_306764 [Basidiobolus meristosporus CBS 931.73]
MIRATIYIAFLVLLAACATQAFSPERLTCLVNRERVSRGLRPLIVNRDLNEDAQHHSESQANRHQMTHSRSDRPDMGDVARSRGYNYRTRAENVAVGDQTEESVVYKWMHSEVHRRNILTPSFTHAGCGFDPRGNYWTMEFLGMDPSRIDYSRVPVCP